MLHRPNTRRTPTALPGGAALPPRGFTPIPGASRDAYPAEQPAAPALGYVPIPGRPRALPLDTRRTATISSPTFMKSLADQRYAESAKALAFSQGASIPQNSAYGDQQTAAAARDAFAKGEAAKMGLAPDYLERQGDMADANRRANAESAAGVDYTKTLGGVNVAQTGAITADTSLMTPRRADNLAANTRATDENTRLVTPAIAAQHQANAELARAQGQYAVPSLAAKTAAEAEQVSTGGHEAIRENANLKKRVAELEGQLNKRLGSVNGVDSLLQSLSPTPASNVGPLLAPPTHPAAPAPLAVPKADFEAWKAKQPAPTPASYVPIPGRPRYQDAPATQQAQPATSSLGWQPTTRPSQPATQPAMATNGLPQPRTTAEAAALPPGTRFMSPDGRIRVR